MLSSCNSIRTRSKIALVKSQLVRIPSMLRAKSFAVATLTPDSRKNKAMKPCFCMDEYTFELLQKTWQKYNHQVEYF